MTARPAISFADALRAARALEPFDPGVRDRILDMLGLTRTDETPAPHAIGVWKPSSTDAVPRIVALPAPIETEALPVEPAPPPSRTIRIQPRRRRTIVKELEPESASPTLPAWLLAPGAALAPATADAMAAVPSEPLFASRTRRAILTAALATIVNEGDIDVEAVVASLTQGRPLVSLPRLRTSTLRRGVQVLVDLGAGMDPFRSDVDQILTAFDDVLADDRMTVLFFTGTPARGVYTTDETDVQPWSTPPAGTPVVLITDLGIGGPPMADERASVAEWLTFARRVRTANHPLIALVPYEAHRWPPHLTRALTSLHWSERTTVGEVRRAVRHSFQTGR